MHPIILFFEDHRDPSAKKILSQHLSHMKALEISILALEIDKGTALAKQLDDVLKHCRLWSFMENLPSEEKEKLFASLPIEKKVEFQHHLSYLPSRKAELELLLRAKQMKEHINFQGIDLILGDIRALTPEQQLISARAMQVEREQAMVSNLAELSVHSGVMAILGLSHYDVAAQLKEQGYEVFCFLPLSMTTEEDSICSQFLKKIELEEDAVQDLTVLDQRTHSIDEIWELITETIQERHASQLRI